jgi:hypothetical protein
MPRKTKQRKCKDGECSEQAVAKGLCPKHYAAARRREAGAVERGDPKPCLLEFRASAELAARLRRVVGDGDRSGVMREALEKHLDRLERS